MKVVYKKILVRKMYGSKKIDPRHRTDITAVFLELSRAFEILNTTFSLKS